MVALTRPFSWCEYHRALPTERVGQRSAHRLMPPSLREWLPEDHLAWFVLDVVADLDLSAFYRGRREDGWGRAAYDPEMMVAVALYAYATNVRSSRAIERRLIEDIAFRVIAANNRPDHATIARFRNTYAEALNGLFGQILGLCVRADLVDPRVVAVDGTKMEANASRHKSVTEKQLQDIAREVIEDARRIDEEEDELYGERRGDELPPHLVDRVSRRRWIREQLDEIKATQARSYRGRKRTARVNTTDPDSRAMKAPNGFIQGYNAQAVVDQNGIVVAAEVSNCGSDQPLFHPMVTAAAANLSAAGAAPMGTVLADAGYLSGDNIESDVAEDVLIAPANRNRIDDIDVDEHERQRMCYRAVLDAREQEIATRCKVLDRLVAGELVLREAAEELGMSVPGVWDVKRRYVQRGRDAVASQRAPHPPTEPNAQQVMARRFVAQEAREIYARRSTIVEPLFAETKWVRGFGRFSLRGRGGCNLEWTLMMTTHNLRKLKASLANRPLTLLQGPRPATA